MTTFVVISDTHQSEAMDLVARFAFPMVKVPWDMDSLTSHRLLQQAFISLASEPSFETESPDFLFFQQGRLCWYSLQTPDWLPVFSDFTTEAFLQRINKADKRSELILRALGKNTFEWSVLDATAGMGIDGFVMATRVREVVMCERSPVAYALLEDGVRRARDTVLAPIVQKIKLRFVDAIQYLSELGSEPAADVIYCDPMFNKSKFQKPGFNKPGFYKSSGSPGTRKNLMALRVLAGEDVDEAALLQLAFEKARRRVVYKAAKSKNFGFKKTPDISYKANSSQFNVYLKH